MSTFFFIVIFSTELHTFDCACLELGGCVASSTGEVETIFGGVISEDVTFSDTIDMVG